MQASPEVDTVLVPVDGIDESVTAAEYAATIAAEYEASLHVIYVLGETAARAVETGAVDSDDMAAESNARIDAVEAYNAKLFGRQNDRGRRIAEAFDLPTFGSSYAHLHGTVGTAWTEFEDDVRGEEALVTALKERRSRTVVRRRDPATRLRRLVEFAHLGYENSWGKLDRLLLSGMEATHPRHIAYDGRFDDVAVY